MKTLILQNSFLFFQQAAATQTAEKQEMMSPILRILLIIGSLLTVVLMLTRIRKAQIQIKDSIFWIVFSGCIVILSVFPQIASWASIVLGFMSPINFVYLFMIFILLVHQFYASMRVSQMDSKIKQLTQQLALQEKEQEDKANSTSE